MSIKIRNSVFETNSSSVHAMIVSKEMPKIEPYNNFIHFGLGEYGWEENNYYDPDDKASYFYTAACSIRGYDVRDEIAALLKPYGIVCKFDDPMFETWTSDYDGSTCTYLTNGSIDHDYECKEFVDTMMNDPEMLIKFLLNEDSFVQTGNDNSDMGWYKDVRNTVYPHDLFIKKN